ncbi:MAG: pentapeptide repeat-containing protein, partial [Micromonosporaceae bacterium]
QAHQERVQTHQERVAAADREHQERLARTTEHDASERRVTELFTSAVEHLGNDKAAVRLGGLYALERLAVEHPEHRQAIVDVVCAYLRMPYPGQDEPGPAGMEVKHEESVRQAAQQVLLRHLRSDAPSHWPGVRVDLAGARLRGFDASGCHFGEVLFHHAVFVHDAHFDGAVFDQVSRWSGTRFGGRAVFADAEWKAPVVFDEPHFGGEVVFDRARFDREMTFRSASPVEQPVSFRRATFGQAAVFDRMEFARPISFSRATFERTVSFEHTRMRADASFRGVSFNDDAMFRWASFHGCAEFESARFAGDAAFGRATFLEQVIFGPHPMGGLVRFRDCRIAGEAPRIWPAGWREKPVDDTWRTLVPDQLGDSPG